MRVAVKHQKVIRIAVLDEIEEKLICSGNMRELDERFKHSGEKPAKEISAWHLKTKALAQYGRFGWPPSSNCLAQ